MHTDEDGKNGLLMHSIIFSLFIQIKGEVFTVKMLFLFSFISIMYCMLPLNNKVPCHDFQCVQIKHPRLGRQMRTRLSTHIKQTKMSHVGDKTGRLGNQLNYIKLMPSSLHDFCPDFQWPTSFEESQTNFRNPREIGA